MSNLYKLFEDLQNNKRIYLRSTTGKEFESHLSIRLIKLGIGRIMPNILDDEKKKILKENVLDKLTTHVIHNPFPEFTESFIEQPYGSQEYPGFIVLEGSKVHSLEAKYSKKTARKPTWNSGLPRPNGIYIFGSFGKNDLTFFRGCDIVTHEDAKKLHGFFEDTRTQDKFNREHMSEQPYGFTAYTRKAFDQGKQFNEYATVDFFANKDRERLEESVISYLKGE